MALLHAFIVAFMALALGCAEEEQPPAKKSHYLQNQTANDSEPANLDAGTGGSLNGDVDGSGDGTTDGSGDGTADGIGDGTVDGSSDGTGDGSTDGNPADAGPITGPGNGVDVHIGIGTIASAPPYTVEVTVHNGLALGSFGFEITGATVNGQTGGAAAGLTDDGWTLALENNAVQAEQSDGGVPLRPTNGSLMILEVDAPNEDAVCTSGANATNAYGDSLIVTGECKPVP